MFSSGYETTDSCNRNMQDQHRLQQRARQYRKRYAPFAQWAQGYGVIQHSDETQVRVYDLCQQLLCEGRYSCLEQILDVLMAADRITSAAMWLVVHMTYSNTVELSGRELVSDDFKENPQGHTGGSLNMVPAYVGYMVANTLSGLTRSWLMGQGHCVAAVDVVNVLLGNLYPEQAKRYPSDNNGLTQLVKDFYSYAINDDGSPGVPLGSHVNPHTAGGLLEGGYLGFAELQYVHMPLPGERLVAFLSDGAFEEQRGSEWASRWWRAEDCGLVTPVMIANGRRIDQRSTMYQQGGMAWFYRHLQNNGFHPIAIDGRDPASYIWGIFESEARLSACSAQIKEGKMCYPVQLPYLIAETEKGFGFYGSGTNAAHGAPLPDNPKYDAVSREHFNQSAAQLFVSRPDLDRAIPLLCTHRQDKREQERDHPLARRQVELQYIPLPKWREKDGNDSPMVAVDDQFCALHTANPELRVRLGNPDELRSNRMSKSLDLLKHRVYSPEEGVAEAVHGSVITALNEEAVVSAALGNKGGINLVVSYEAFAVKMLGALRQEIIFARHQKVLGRTPRWLSVPVIATSHLWENGKNEQSHQDSTFGEALLAEMSDVSRVVYPADSNSAMACLNACYQSHGQIWAMTIPKQEIPNQLSAKQAQELVMDGAITLEGEGGIQLVAVGAYQLFVCKEVRKTLKAIGIDCRITYLLEPGRYRNARDSLERDFVVDERTRLHLFPDDTALRIFVTHTRPEVLLGTCRPLDLGPKRCLAFGYINQGGTLDTRGLLKANKSDADTISQIVEQKANRLEEHHAKRE